MRSRTILTVLALLAILVLVPDARAGDAPSFLGGWLNMDSPPPIQVKVKGVGKGTVELERVRFSGGYEGGAFSVYLVDEITPTWARVYSSAGVLHFYYDWSQKKRRVTCTPHDEEDIVDFVRVMIEEALGLDHETHSVEVLKTKMRAKVARDGESARLKFEVKFRVTATEGSGKARKGRMKLKVTAPREPPH